MGVKFGTEEGLHAKFHPHWCNVSPLRGEKPQNRPLSKLNTGRFVLCAMLPVKSLLTCISNKLLFMNYKMFPLVLDQVVHHFGPTTIANILPVLLLH